MKSRRNFIKNGLALSAASQLPFPLKASESAPKKHFFVMIRAFGGMDVTLGLDPWTKSELPDEKDMYIEYRPDDLIVASQDVKLGPAASPLKQHGRDLSVINGVFMNTSDNGHPAGETYMTTGDGRGLSPSLVVELAQASSEGDFGVLYNTFLLQGGRTVLGSSTNEVRDVRSERNLASLLSPIIHGEATPYNSAMKRLIGTQATSRKVAQWLNEFDSSSNNQIEDHKVIAAAFKGGASQYAQIDIPDPGLDTHGDHPVNHMNAQRTVWTAVDNIFSFFKSVPFEDSGESLFDRTTFMVFSEFARTSALNQARGKDHNPKTNSVLLAGRGFKKGKVFGGSRVVTRAQSVDGNPYHIAYPIDFKTGQPQLNRRPGTELLFPENLMRTMAKIMNVDMAKFQSVPQRFKTLDSILA